VQEIGRNWYYRHRLQAQQTANRRYAAKRAFVDGFLNACAHCGIEDRRVLQFHHVRGKKLGNVSEMLKNRTFCAIQAEIEKCVVLCANCHNIAEWEARGVPKYKESNA
jgi:hypothetical protein